jgi:hypothetical protein
MRDMCRRGAVLALVFCGACTVFAACGDSGGVGFQPVIPTSPSPASPSLPGGSLSGFVYVSGPAGDGLAPPGLQVSAEITVRPDRCCGPGTRTSRVIQTDGQGRYQLTDLPGGAYVGILVWDDVCSARVHRLGPVDGDAAFDVRLIQHPHAAPPNPGPGRRHVSGVAYEITSSGQRPVAGASLWAGEDLFEPLAWSYSDNNGSFLLCNLPAEDVVLFVKAWESNTHNVSVVVPAAADDISVRVR